MNRFLEHVIVYLQWFILTAVALPVGLLAGSAILAAVGVQPDSGLMLVASFLLAGIVVAIAQLLVLDRKNSSSIQWIFLTAIGIGVGGWVLARVLNGSTRPVVSMLAAGLGALAPGLIQIGMLNSPSWRRAEWLLLTVLGWVFASTCGSLFTAQTNPVDGLLSIGVAQRLSIVGWAISGLIAVLLLLLFTPIAKRRELTGRIIWLP